MTEKPTYEELEKRIQKLEQTESNRKQAEEIKKVLFTISNAVNSTRNLKDLFGIIHNALGNIVDVTNFFIAMVDIKKRTLYFPYHVDTNDYDFFPITNFDTNNSLTGLVVSQRRPVLLKKNDLEKLSSQKGVWGPVPLIWMGAPLIVKDEVIGVVAVQSYLDSNLYNKQDLQVLSVISDQMAIAIDRTKSEALLKESEHYLANIINAIGDPIFVKDEQFRFVLVNDALCTFLGKTRDELVGTTGMEFLPKDQMDHFLEIDRKVLSSEEDQLNEESLTDGDSTIRIIVTKKTCYIDAQGAKFIVGVIRDITDRKQAEEEVKERTNELEDINIALKVLLKKGENDKKEMEEKISSNFKSLISPFIKKLKKRLTEKNQKNLMYIIESNMQEFFKPFSKKMSDQMLKLTPAEIQIASMIKEGLSNKEIAQILNNSVRTITNHRQHIRRKFDLENKKVNLRSYLSTL